MSHDPAPLILTLGLAQADQDRFQRLRLAHFPPERNLLAAHVTLFHHLPADNVQAVVARLVIVAGEWAPFAVTVTGLRLLGTGVAFALESAALSRLRAGLATCWWDWLTPQDRQGFRPHVTVQNKVAPERARSLLATLRTDFIPFDIAATGLLLWRYRAGPWQHAAALPFTGPTPDPLAHRRR